jgi:hypothetical protein
MSANFNQTNINATTSFFGAGGGGSNFPNGIEISSNSGNQRYLNITNQFWANPTLTLTSDGYIQETSLTADQFNALSPGTTPAKSASYSYNQIYYQGNAGAGSNSTFLNVNDAGLNNNTTPCFNMYNVSTMNTTPGTTANMTALFSTLKNVYPSNFL